MMASGGKMMARMTRRRDIRLFFKGFQCPTELVGTGGELIAAADAVEFLDHVVNLLAGHQAADALEVAVAAAQKEYLLDDAVVINGHINQLRAGALGFVEGVFHISSNPNDFKYSKVPS